MNVNTHFEPIKLSGREKKLTVAAVRSRPCLLTVAGVLMLFIAHTHPSVHARVWHTGVSCRSERRAAILTAVNIAVKTACQGGRLKMEEEFKALTWWWQWRWRLGGSHISGCCRHHQLCSSSVRLFPDGLRSLCTLSRGSVGVGGGDVLALNCGDFQSVCACFCLQGGDFCGVIHPSWGPLGLARRFTASWVRRTGMRGQGGGCSGKHCVRDGGIGRWLGSRAADGAAEPGGWGCRWGWCGGRVGGGEGSGFESVFLCYLGSVKEKKDINKRFPPYIHSCASGLK